MKFLGVKPLKLTWRSSTVVAEDTENMQFPQLRKLKKIIHKFSSFSCTPTQWRPADLKLVFIKMLTALIKVFLFIPRHRHLSSHIRTMSSFSILWLRCFKSEYLKWLSDFYFLNFKLIIFMIWWFHLQPIKDRWFLILDMNVRYLKYGNKKI